MTIADWTMILAVLLAPIAAVQVQRFLELLRDTRNRKLAVFYTLMGTRAARTSVPHVEALNRIDLEFGGRLLFGKRRVSAKEKAVLAAWKEYLDVLNDRGADVNRWSEKREEAFIGLLHAMALAVGYDFDRVFLRKAIYSPQAHLDFEVDQHVARKAMVELLSGKRSLPVRIIGQGEGRDAPDSDDGNAVPPAEPSATPPSQRA